MQLALLWYGHYPQHINSGTSLRRSDGQATDCRQMQRLHQFTRAFADTIRATVHGCSSAVWNRTSWLEQSDVDVDGKYERKRGAPLPASSILKEYDTRSNF